MSRFLAIDLEASGLFVASGTVRSDAVAVEKTLAWEDSRLPLTNENATALGESFKDALKAAGIAAAPVLVSVGRDRVILKELRYPAVRPSQEPNIVRFQAMKDLSEAPDDLVLDYVPTSEANGERRATAFVLKKDYHAAIQAFVLAAGLKLAAITPRPFAIAAALHRVVTLAKPEDAVAVITLGAHGGEFTVLRGDHITFTRTISAQAMANGDTLSADVKRNLAVYGGSNSRAPLAELYLAEPTSPGYLGKLRLMLPLPVQPFDPFLSTDMPGENASRFTGAVGLLALRRAAELPINFASPRQPRAEADPNRKALLLTALACTLLLGLGFVYGFLELNRASENLASAERQKKNAEEILTSLDADAKRLQAVDDWTKREVVWLDELYDLFDRFPDIDRARVSSFKGEALPVDRVGKQPAQAKVDVRLNTGSPDAVNALLAAFDRDNTERNKYYVNPIKTAGGLVSGTSAGALNLLFTISTLVNHRPASDFVRQALASPPPVPTTQSSTDALPAATVTTTPSPAAPTAKTPETKSSSGFRPANFNDDWFK